MIIPRCIINPETSVTAQHKLKQRLRPDGYLIVSLSINHRQNKPPIRTVNYTYACLRSSATEVPKRSPEVSSKHDARLQLPRLRNLLSRFTILVFANNSPEARSKTPSDRSVGNVEITSTGRVNFKGPSSDVRTRPQSIRQRTSIHLPRWIFFFDYMEYHKKLALIIKKHYSKRRRQRRRPAALTYFAQR